MTSISNHFNLPPVKSHLDRMRDIRALRPTETYAEAVRVYFKEMVDDDALSRPGYVLRNRITSAIAIVEREHRKWAKDRKLAYEVNGGHVVASVAGYVIIVITVHATLKYTPDELDLDDL